MERVETDSSASLLKYKKDEAIDSYFFTNLLSIIAFGIHSL